MDLETIKARADVPALIREVEQLQKEHSRVLKMFEIVAAKDSETGEVAFGEYHPDTNEFVVPDAVPPLTMQNDKLRAELEAARERGNRKLIVSDGFGSNWPPCDKHEVLIPLTIMRPGDARCAWCEVNNYATRLHVELDYAKANCQESVEEADTLRRAGEEMAKAAEQLDLWVDDPWIEEGARNSSRLTLDKLLDKRRTLRAALTAWESTKGKL